MGEPWGRISPKNTMNTTKRPWLKDFLALEAPARLTREEFVARYLPKYSKPYVPRSGILMRGNGKGCRVVNTGSGAKSAIARRENRISEAFEAYLSDYASHEQSGQWVSHERAEQIRASFNKSIP